MWKYCSRRIREPVERGVNHFERNAVNCPFTNNNDEPRKRGPPCEWFASRPGWGAFRAHKNDTNRKKWNFDQLNRSWISAITWSGAIVFGWYTSQIIHLKTKKHLALQPRKYVSITSLIAALHPYVPKYGPSGETKSSATNLEDIVEKFIPTVHLMTNDQSGVKEDSTHTSSSENISSSSRSSDDLGDVLNSIENRLGLAAIERGQHDVGLNLLKSAANRHHAPALFNLALCYESGLGVPLDEKTAAEFYKSAAALDHPGALYNLGIYYGQGRGGLKRDIPTATRLLRLAAVQGQQDAIDALKTLELEINPRIEVDPWMSRHNSRLQNETVTPSQSALFVENLLFTNRPPTTVF